MAGRINLQIPALIFKTSSDKTGSFSARRRLRRNPGRFWRPGFKRWFPIKRNHRAARGKASGFITAGFLLESVYLKKRQLGAPQPKILRALRRLPFVLPDLFVKSAAIRFLMTGF